MWGSFFKKNERKSSNLQKKVGNPLTCPLPPGNMVLAAMEPSWKSAPSDFVPICFFKKNVSNLRISHTKNYITSTNTGCWTNFSNILPLLRRFQVLAWRSGLASSEPFKTVIFIRNRSMSELAPREIAYQSVRRERLFFLYSSPFLLCFFALELSFTAGGPLHNAKFTNILRGNNDKTV